MFGRKVKRIEPIESEERLSEPMESDGFSLEELSQAYAQAVGVPNTADENATNVTTIPVEHPMASSSELLDEDLLDAPEVKESDGVHVTTETVLEAALFLGNADNQPIDTDRLLGLLRNTTLDELHEAVSRLNSKYRADQRAFEIVSERGGFSMRLVPEMSIVRERFYGKVKETHLTQSSVDCLAIVAYQPGITRDEVDALWGQPSISTLNVLIRKGMLRAEKEGKQLRYYTTDRFLDVIGLASLDDLPKEET